MVVLSNPFCPVSFGLLGFLGAVISRQTSLLGLAAQKKREETEFPEEEADLLVHDDGDCGELSEDRIANFLQNQKQQFFTSIGMTVPPSQQRGLHSSATTPGTSMIELPSSRETSYLDETEESALLTLTSVSDANPVPPYQPAVYCMSESEQDKEDLEDHIEGSPLESSEFTAGTTEQNV